MTWRFGLLLHNVIARKTRSHSKPSPCVTPAILGRAIAPFACIYASAAEHLPKGILLLKDDQVAMEAIALKPITISR